MTDQFPQKGSIEDELAQLAKQIPALPTDYADLRRLLALLPSPLSSDNPAPDAGNPALNSVSAAQPSQSSSPLLGPAPGTTPSAAIATTGVITHGWQAYSQQQGVGATDVLTTAHDLAADGGMLAFPVEITAPMMLERVSVWNTDTASERSWNWGLYEQVLSVTSSKTLNRIAAGMAPDTFTPGAASKRAVPYFNAQINQLTNNYKYPLSVCFSLDSAYAYVLVHNAIHVIRASDNAISATLTIPAGNLNDMAMSPSGAYLYITQRQNIGNVFVVSTSTLTVVATVDGFTQPDEIVFTPNGQYVYVSQYTTIASGGCIKVIQTSNNTVVATTVAIEYPHGLKMAPDGNALWFLDSTTYGARRIQTSDHTIVAGTPTWITNFPQALVVTPDSAYVYATCRYGVTKVIRTSDNTVYATITGGANYVYEAKITPNGAYIYVPDGDALVHVIRTSDNTMYATIGVSVTNPSYLAITPDGNFVYVTGQDSSTCAIIRTSDNLVIDVVAVADTPQQVYIAPNGTRAVVAGQYGTIRLTLINPVFAVMVSPGVYWLVIQNNHLTNTFGLGSAATGTLSHNRAQSKTIKVPNKVLANIQTSMNAYQNDLVSLPDSSKVYIASSYSDNVKVVTTSSDTVTATIAMTNPWAICMSPDGAYVYVVENSLNQVRRIDTSSDTITGSTATVGTSPYDIVITPDGAYLYVCNYTGETVSVIRTSDMTVVATVSPLDGRPQYIFMSPDGAHVVVQTYNSTTFVRAAKIIRTSDNTIVATIAGNGNINDMAFSTDSSYVYIGCSTLIPVRLSDYATMTPIQFTYNSLEGVRVSPDNMYIYCSCRAASTVEVVRVSDRQWITSISVPGNSYYGAFAPDGLTYYIPGNNSDVVTAIRVSDHSVIDTIRVQPYSYPYIPHILANGSKLYVSTQDASPAQLHVISVGDPTKVDFVAATWAKHTSVYAAVMEGRVFGQTSAF